ncbi:apoptotic protease-activating factor 1-like [Xenia sp. Carnegie-2017]|uniref:apoptotic protease-activating factor 1-like n=1 Tax=Xenia sp. Carnegie-2017 TaxID=2897299 RepID=UPI001F03B5EE|nr:apoptotic protease-activating factor 1-like [Xenia sp. Carnegie-2017]
MEYKDASWFDCLSGKCQLLITTRDADVVRGLKGIEIYELQIMPKDQSRQLLYNCAQVSTDKQSTLSVKLQRIVEELLEQCRGLPLALSIIGATLIDASSEQDWQDTLDELKSANLQQLSIKSKKDVLPGEYQYTNVSAAIDVSLKRLRQKKPEYEEKFFDFAIFPEDTDIPSDILELFWSSENIPGRNTCSAKKTRDILRLLERKSLLQKGPVIDEKTSYRVHDLVLDYAREKLRSEDPYKQRSVEDVQGQFLVALRKQCRNREWPCFNGKRDYFFRYLPYHLDSAKEYEELQQLFFNFQWLQQKVKETNLPSLISDFRFLEHPSYEIKLLKSSLMLSADVIESSPNSLGTQLLGRLLSYEEQFPRVKLLLSCATTCHLVPLFPCLSDPTGPLEKIFRKHCDKVLALVTTVGPSGLIVISASKDCLIKVHELETVMELEVLRGHTMEVYCLALSHCGTKLASGSYDSTTRLWNLDTYKLLFIMEAEGGFVNALDFSIDDKRLFSGSNDGNMRIWNVANGKLLDKTQAHETNMHIRGLCTTRDGRMIATGSLDYNVKLWDASTLSHLATLKGHTDTVYAVAATCDSKMIVSASGDKTLKIWNLQSFGEVRTLKGHQGEIYSVAVSSDSKHIVSGGQDMDVRLWCFETGKSLFCFKGHSQSIRSVLIISNGRKALSGSQDKTFRMWDLDTNKHITDNSFRGHSEDVMDIAVTQDGSNCVSSSMDGTIKIWKCIEAKERFTLRENQIDLAFFCVLNAPMLAMPYQRVINVSISNDGDHVVSLGKDSLIKVWRLNDGKEIRGISGDKQARLVRFDLDDKLVLIGCKDNQIFLWDWKNDDKAKRLTLPSYTTMEIAFQKNLKQIEDTGKSCSVVSATAFTCSRNNEVCKIDLNSLKATFVSQGPNPSCMKMVVLPKGDAILAGIVTDSVFIYWELSSWREIRYKADHPQNSVITAIDITKDGKFALTGSSLGTISLVNLGSSKVVQKFNNTESGEGVRLISMLPNDLNFIIVDEANRVELRNFSNSCEKVPLGQPGAKVNCVAPLGLQYILLGCDNGILLYFHHQKNNPTEYPKYAFKESVTQVQGHPNEEYLYFAVGTQCGSVKLWFVEKSTPPKLIEIWSHEKVHLHPITALAFMHGAEDVLCGSYDNFVVHVNSTEVVRTYSYKSYGIAALRVVEENLLVAAYIRGFSVVKWRLKDGEIVEKVHGGAGREQVSRAYLAPEETDSHEQLSGTCIERIVSKGSHHSLLHWELKTGKIIHRMHGHSHDIRALAFIPGGEFLVSGSRDKTLKIWNLKNGQLMEEFHFEHYVLAIACAENGTACVGLQGGQVCFLRINTLAANAQ